MGFTDNDWVALNLPKTAKFKKNGVVLGVADAIASALEVTAVNGQNRKEYALAMLLRMIGMDYPFDSFTLGPMTYTGSQLTKLADDWEMRGDGLLPGTIVSVAIAEHRHCFDEFGGWYDPHNGCG